MIRKLAETAGVVVENCRAGSLEADQAVLPDDPGSGAPGAPRRLPVAGFTYEHGVQHTVDVLAEIGYDPEAVAALAAGGAVGLGAGSQS